MAHTGNSIRHTRCFLKDTHALSLMSQNLNIDYVLGLTYVRKWYTHQM